jgi:hypothetical protein
MTAPYNPHHPVFAIDAVSTIEPFLSLPQTEVLIELYEASWKFIGPTPMLLAGGTMLVSAERHGKLGIVRLEMQVLQHGQIIKKTERQT